jgi:hypothetical protein
MTKELHVVDVDTGEVVERVDVSRRGQAEVDKAREALLAKITAGHEVRDVD